MPNLVFPALTPVVATAGDTLALLLPPPKAVGESPPWPFDEDPGWVVAIAAEQLHPTCWRAKWPLWMLPTCRAWPSTWQRATA